MCAANSTEVHRNNVAAILEYKSSGSEAEDLPEEEL